MFFRSLIVATGLFILGQISSAQVNETIPAPNPSPSDPQPPVSEEVELQADLRVITCTHLPNSETLELCLGGQLVKANQRITLYPISTDSNPEDITLRESRGFWSQVIEKDGVRFIAIITISHYYYRQDPGGYSLRAEILDDNGKSGEMSIYLLNMEGIPTGSLKGRSVRVGRMTFTPSLNIGPAFHWPDCPSNDGSNNQLDKSTNTPITCQSSIAPATRWPMPNPSFWEVQAGQLQQ